MASTYSTNLAIELIGTGDQSGTWGTTTNTNLGTLIEQAISGYVTYACSGGTDTITIPNGASGVARNMYIELTGTGGGTVLVPTNKKLYFVYNNTASNAVTVKVSGQTGVSVPNGKKMVLVSNGTDVVEAANYITSFSTGSLSVASLNVSGLTASQAVFTNGSKNLVSNAITGSGNVVMSTSPTLVTPALGTPSSGTLSSCTGLPISTGVSGLGTGVATALAVNTGTAGAFVVNGGALGTPSSGNVTNLTGTASININGTVGATTPNTGAFTTLSTTGALTYGGVTLSNSVTGTGSMVLSTSPTITTPTLSGTTTAGAINSTGDISTSSSLVAQSGTLLVGSSSKQLYLRTSGGFNRIDSYDNPITATVPLLINASSIGLQIADSTKISIDSSGMNGVLGATTPAAATVTTLTASGSLSLTGLVDHYMRGGAVLYWNSTGASGGTTYAYIQATTGSALSLSASGGISLLGAATVTGTLSATGAGIVGGTTARTNTQFSVIGANAKATASSQDVASFSSSDANGSELALVVSLTGSATAANRLASIQSVEQGTAYRDLVLNPSGGNLGLGVTPSTWSTGKIIEIGYVGNAIWSSSTNAIRLSTNVVYNTGYQYAANGTAARYDQGSGGHYWYSAASGTQGSAIPFTNTMTLDGSGNLNNTGTFTVGTAGGNVSWGTYTPTMTAITSVSTVSASGAWQYMRVGNTVTVSGQLVITGGGSGAQIRATLPVASALTNDYQLAGSGAVYETSSGVSIIADTANDAAYMFQQNASGNETWTVTFTYRVI